MLNRLSHPGAPMLAFMRHVLPFLPSGLVRHVCDLFTETATLCLDVDNKNHSETAATLLFSLLDILHGMLTYTACVVRLALQVWDLPSRVWSTAPCGAPSLSSSPT